MKSFRTLALCVMAAAGCAPAWAGYDMYGTVTALKQRPDGLWFDIAPNPGMQPLTNFCLNGGMFIPTSDPQYPYYYGLLLTSLTKSRAIGLFNLSTFNGTAYCDITKTGYGVYLF